MSKEKKKGNKKGCLSKILIAVVIILIIVSGVTLGLSSSKDLFGEKLEVVKSYVEAINQPVDESKLITNPVKSYAEFKAVADLSGFAENPSGEVNLDSTLNLKDNLFGAYLNSFINGKEELLRIKEFNITSENSLRIVFMYDLKKVKDTLKLEIVPDKMYITNDYLISYLKDDGGLNQIKYEVIDSLINQIDKNMSNSILSYLKGIDDQGISKMFKEYERIVFKKINDLAIQTQSMLTFTYVENVGMVNYTK